MFCLTVQLCACKLKENSIPFLLDERFLPNVVVSPRNDPGQTSFENVEDCMLCLCQ